MQAVPSGSALLRHSTADSRLHARLRPGAEFPWVEQVCSSPLRTSDDPLITL